MGLFGVFHGDHDHTCLDTACEPVATRIGPAAPNVYGPLPSLNDWLKCVLKREIPREQLDALVANGVRRPFHLATLSTSRFGACGFDGNEVRTVNAIAAAAVNRTKPGALLLPVRIWGQGTDDRMRLAEVVAECSATHVVRLSLVWHIWGRGRVEHSFPEAELCGDVSRHAAKLKPWEHVKYLNCVFEKDWVYAFDAIRPVPQHRLVALKVKTSSGKKHRLRIGSGHAKSERRHGRKALGRVKIRLDPPAPKGWGLCGLDARPGATGIGGLGARWSRVREARCDWSTYVASDTWAAERRRLAAAVDQRRRTSQDRENVNNVTGRVAVEQQDAMLRALDRPVAPVRATIAVTPSAPPLLPAAAVARVASDAPVMAPARVPSVTPMHRRVTRHLWPSAPPLPEAEVIATTAVAPTVAEVVWPEAPTEVPTAYAEEGYSAQWTEA